MLDLLYAQRGRVGLGECATGVGQLPVATLGAAGIAGALQPIMRPAWSVLVGGLTTGDGLLPLGQASWRRPREPRLRWHPPDVRRESRMGSMNWS